MCIEYSLTAKDIQEQAEFLKEFHEKYGFYFFAFVAKPKICRNNRTNISKDSFFVKKDEI